MLEARNDFLEWLNPTWVAIALSFVAGPITQTFFRWRDRRAGSRRAASLVAIEFVPEDEVGDKWKARLTEKVRHRVPGRLYEVYLFKITNSSDEPVVLPHARLHRPEDERGVITKATVHGTKLGDKTLGTVAPGAARKGIIVYRSETANGDQVDPWLSVEFSMAGKRWLVYDDGSLVKMPNPRWRWAPPLGWLNRHRGPRGL